MKPKGWRNESRRHSLASKGIKTAQKIPRIPKEYPKKADINDYLKINLDEKMESKTSRTFNFPQEDKVVMQEKETFSAGKFKDLFKDGDRVKIFNGMTGEVVRELRKEGDKVIIDPKSGNPEDIIKVDLDTDLIYEPWFMDRGSILFHAPKGMVGTPQGQLLKLSCEQEPIEIYKR